MNQAIELSGNAGAQVSESKTQQRMQG